MPDVEKSRKLSRSSPSYWVRAPIDAWLRREGAAVSGLRVVDIGCGDKPYAPYFSSAVEYVGFDLPENPVADVHGHIEEMPFDDETFDVVTCIQVLEHVEDPLRAVSELHRITKRGGRVLLSTHGTQVYHPSPNDYWRWTQAGLARLFLTAGSWDSVTVVAGAGTGATLAMLISTYVDLAGDKLHVPLLGQSVTRVLNRAGGGLDRRSRRLREPGPGSLIANFHVTAVR